MHISFLLSLNAECKYDGANLKLPGFCKNPLYYELEGVYRYKYIYIYCNGICLPFYPDFACWASSCGHPSTILSRFCLMGINCLLDSLSAASTHPPFYPDFAWCTYAALPAEGTRPPFYLDFAWWTSMPPWLTSSWGHISTMHFIWILFAGHALPPWLTSSCGHPSTISPDFDL